ncbi:BON domain-containing protein [Aliiglaciecola litoralis]|uniref:Division/outer membrane stress-associated lipid-binding lipoprotein n=1 Tax=Aliiglaciecola litoralis TaxID=582857 RepID=A0ABN1LG98_9ALTE
MKFSAKWILSWLLLCALLQGCAAVVVGAGMGAASAVHDRRTLGTQLDDKTAVARLSSAFGNNPRLASTNIDISVYNGIALIAGQAPSEELRQEIANTAATVKNLKKIHNQVRIGQPISASVTANDMVIETKVKAALLGDKRIDGLQIEVEVEDSEVFLMGLVSDAEADIAVDISRNINGVARVIKAFERR